jgi:proton-translocating NADH-quinone oxidoreductase chain N
VALISVAPKIAGMAVLVRFLEMGFSEARSNWAAVLSALACASMLLGNLAAIPQTNIKRMLAYSSIGQIGYVLIAAAAMTRLHGDWRIPGIFVYLLVYTFMNIGAFAVVTAVSHAGLGEMIDDYRGLIRQSPFLAAALVIFLASLAGLPPTAGFWGKALIFGAAIDSGLTWLAVVGVVCSVISVYYYFNVARVMFFFRATSKTKLAIPYLLGAGILIGLIGTLLIGVYPEPFIAATRVGQDILAAR